MIPVENGSSQWRDISWSMSASASRLDIPLFVVKPSMSLLWGLEVAGIPVCDKGRCRVDLCQGEFKKVKLEQG